MLTVVGPGGWDPVVLPAASYRDLHPEVMPALSSRTQACLPWKPMSWLVSEAPPTLFYPLCIFLKTPQCLLVLALIHTFIFFPTDKNSPLYYGKS